MRHNDFWFNGSYFLQGFAMGSYFAPSMANLNMANWEEDLVYGYHRLELVLWRRYIDDVLLLWNKDVTSLDALIGELILMIGV